MNAQSKIEAVDTTPDNLRIWNALGKTDPAHTKPFKRSGGFSGTALKPIWMERRLTELFGPCGIGWGTDEPCFRVVEAGEEMLVYCTVRGWYVDSGQRAEVFGVGGDKVVSKTKYGLQADDEAFKKACTDAIGNAFKHVGVGADIHMGQFDDSKYVEEVGREFRAEEADAARAETAMCSDDQRDIIQALGPAVGKPVAEICASYKVGSLKELTESQATKLIERLNTMEPVNA